GSRSPPARPNQTSLTRVVAHPRGGREAPDASPVPSAPPEPAPAGGKLFEALLERASREIGPQLVAKHELGVGALPEQVVGDPLLAAGSDDQVGVVHVGGVQLRAE